MNMRTLMGVGILAGILLTVAGIAEAGSNSIHQKKLVREQAQIDAAVAQAGGTIAKILSDKFGLEPEEIQKIKDGGPMAHFEGKPEWGEITILLSMARQLQKTHPADYPTYEKALGKISSLRDENTTYELIADRLEFNLQPVIAESQRIRQSLKREKR